MSVGKALKDYRLGKLVGADGKPIKTAKEAVALGRSQEGKITAAQAGAALAGSTGKD